MEEDNSQREIADFCAELSRQTSALVREGRETVAAAFAVESIDLLGGAVLRMFSRPALPEISSASRQEQDPG